MTPSQQAEVVREPIPAKQSGFVYNLQRENEALRVEVDTLAERIIQLQELLAPPAVIVPVEWKLTPTEQRMFCALACRDTLSREQALAVMYGASNRELPDRKLVDVLVAHIRRKLAPFGVEIETLWGLGYALKNRKAHLPGVIA